MKTDEVIVLESALKAVTDHFNEFVGACLDADGKPRAPSMKDVMRARACLPARCEYAFKAKA